MNINHMLVAIVLIASLPAGAAAQSTPPRSIGKDLMTQDLVFMVKDIGAPATTLVTQ